MDERISLSLLPVAVTAIPNGTTCPQPMKAKRASGVLVNDSELSDAANRVTFSCQKQLLIYVFRPLPAGW